MASHGFFENYFTGLSQAANPQDPFQGRQGGEIDSPLPPTKLFGGFFQGDSERGFTPIPVQGGPDRTFNLYSRSSEPPARIGNTKAGQGRRGGRQDLFAEQPGGSAVDSTIDFDFQAWLDSLFSPQPQFEPQVAEFEPFDFTQQTTLPQFGVSGVPFGPQNSNATQGSTISTILPQQSEIMNQILQMILSGSF